MWPATVRTARPRADKDVDQTQWYHNAVDYVLGNDLMKGTGKTTFSRMPL